MANLIVCCDGTWNTPDDEADGVPTPTNVVKIAGCVASVDASGKEQKKYYHPGVGTDGGVINSLAGGGLGVGLGDNVKSAYKWLSVNYQPNDKIFLFGFSRGAFTVRSLAGMIGACGLLDLSSPQLTEATLWRQVDKVFANYRRKKPDPSKLKGMDFHNAGSDKIGAGKTPIHFLGVWDTVGALGIPDEVAFLNLLDDPKKHGFHDTKLSNLVIHARHAVAMDEQRRSFTPTLWTNQTAHNDMRQIWFPGVHSDVGGGYPQTGLSDGALLWMLKEAEASGLVVREGAVAQIDPNPLDVLHDSLSGAFKALTTRPRSVPCISGVKAPKKFHVSALERQANPPLAQPDYWPSKTLSIGQMTTVDVFAREKWNPTGLYLEKGKTYEFSALGEWVDRSIKCGPSGTKDGKFSPGEVFHVAGAALGSIETIFKKVTGNDEANFWLTRRYEDVDWFALVGVIANGKGIGKNNRVIEHEVFVIGNGVTYTPKSGGYLYAFANDAWQMYFNNKGSVRLSVKRP